MSRILVNFDLTHISQSVNRANASASAKYYLNLYDAGSIGLTTSQSLYAYPVSASWLMGRGKYLSSPNVTDRLPELGRIEIMIQKKLLGRYY